MYRLIFTLFLLLILPLVSEGAVVLQYHHVSTESPAVTSISPGQFENHLKIIEEEGFRVIPLPEMLEMINQKPWRNEKVVSVTFDDAYHSIYENAFPLLRKRGWPFTVFVSTAYVGTNASYYLSWQQLREMQAHGATIANHTHSHLHMLRKPATLSDKAWLARLEGDIRQAQTLLTTHLSAAPELFAYPYGEYNLQILQLISELGYKGFGQQSGALGPSLDQRLLPRFPMSGQYGASESLREKLYTLALPVTSPATEPLVEKHNPPQLSLTTEAGLSLELLSCYGPGGRLPVETKGNHFSTRALQPLQPGRSRYNCTLPAGDGYFYWFSQLWITPMPDGSWYPEL
ncbi:MAG: polysaccharide deacetylase family protein [Pseudomonadales bacterium]|nr:polysaccharide deacetylase family protein [Pseudomonadales bacterium]